MPSMIRNAKIIFLVRRPGKVKRSRLAFAACEMAVI